MATTTTARTVCDFCECPVNKKMAGYLSDGAGLHHDFCGRAECVTEAKEIHRCREASGCQIWIPKSRGETDE